MIARSPSGRGDARGQRFRGASEGTAARSLSPSGAPLPGGCSHMPDQGPHAGLLKRQAGHGRPVRAIIRGRSPKRRDRWRNRGFECGHEPPSRAGRGPRCGGDSDAPDQAAPGDTGKGACLANAAPARQRHLPSTVTGPRRPRAVVRFAFLPADPAADRRLAARPVTREQGPRVCASSRRPPTHRSVRAPPPRS